MKNFPSYITETYVIENELGAGSGGVVYKAFHKRLKKYVVIKELKHTHFLNEEARRNEVEALKNLKHPHLPQIIDFFGECENSYTIMELLEGITFKRLIEQNEKISPYKAIEWYGQLVSALVMLHENGICHCDIKPANIMLQDSGKVCLIDFNTAMVKGNDTGLISRSRGYASPEQYGLFVCCRNNEQPQTKYVDWKLSDIHNLGAAMYHLMTGKRMKYDKQGKVLSENFNKHHKSPIFFIIERSTHPNPGNRFTSIHALNQTIQSIIRV